MMLHVLGTSEGGKKTKQKKPPLIPFLFNYQMAVSPFCLTNKTQILLKLLLVATSLRKLELELDVKLSLKCKDATGA